MTVTAYAASSYKGVITFKVKATVTGDGVATSADTVEFLTDDFTVTIACGEGSTDVTVTTALETLSQAPNLDRPQLTGSFTSSNPTCPIDSSEYKLIVAEGEANYFSLTVMPTGGFLIRMGNYANGVEDTY